MDTPSRLQDLIALAQEPSSKRRRELLRRVTDIFLAEAPCRSATEAQGFDAVFCTLADEMEADVRPALAGRSAPPPAPPAPPTSTIRVAHPASQPTRNSIDFASQPHVGHIAWWP